MSQIDWAKLYEQGRCKNYGVPWSEEEANAVFLLGIPAEYVRRGCMTVEAYEAMNAEDVSKIEKTGKVPLTQCKREKLLLLCSEYKINATDEATRSVLIEELRAAGCPSSVEV